MVKRGGGKKLTPPASTQRIFGVNIFRLKLMQCTGHAELGVRRRLSRGSTLFSLLTLLTLQYCIDCLILFFYENTFAAKKKIMNNTVFLRTKGLEDI